MANKRSDILIGWKDIAAYMGCSVNTARRREKAGLPVFRTGGLVNAYPDDIDKWIKGQRAKTEEKKSVPESIETAESADDVSAVLEKLLRGDTDERFAIVRMGKDVDEYERIQVQLKSTEDKYRTLVEEIPEWVWETDANGRYTYSSPRVLEITGYTAEEVIGFDPMEFLVFDDDKPIFGEAVLKIRECKEVISGLLCRFIAKYGSVNFVEISAAPVYDSAGAFNGISGIIRDVTKRVSAERALKEAHDLLEQRVKERTKDLAKLNEELRSSRDLLDQIVNGIYEDVLVIAPDFRIKMINDCFGIRYNNSKEEAVGRYCYELSHSNVEPCKPEECVCPVREVVKSVEPVMVEHTHKISFGRDRLVGIFAFPLFDSNGEVESVVQIVHDIDKRRLDK